MRNNIDFFIYYFKFNKAKCIITAVNIVLFIVLLNSSPVSIFDINAITHLPKLSLMALVGYVFNIFWSVLDLFLDIKSYSTKSYTLKKVEHERKISPQVGCSLTTVTGAGRAIHSNEVDKLLIDSENLQMEIDKRIEKKVKMSIKEKRDTLFMFLQCQLRNANAEGAMFFNEKKLCLSCDESDWRKSVICHKGEYYDTYVTNISSNRIVVPSDGEERIIADGRMWFPYRKEGDKYYLKSLAASGMNNEIGVSTLGITKDNYLFIWKQNNHNLSNKSFYASSGSGSCDWNDYKKGGKNFIKVISSAMEREMWEESGGKLICNKYEQIGNTKVIGFFRWVEKAGKPEFLGVTKMNFNYSPIKANPKEILSGGEGVKVTEENIEQKINELMHKEKVSLPLYMNLVALKNYITKNKEEAFNFLFGK